MSQMEERSSVRLAVVGLLILSLMGLLVSRLWFLQVLSGEALAERATENSVRLISVEAPRGRILDRQGRVLVANRTALAVGIRKDDLPRDEVAANAVKKRLAKLLGITVKEINLKLADRRTSPYKPVVIAEDVPREVIFTVSERRDPDYLGVETLSLPVRFYPRGSIAAHVIGYVGEVNERELAKAKAKGTYRLGDTIGRTGIESQYEKVLRGKSGWEKLAVDASGRVDEVLGRQDEIPGRDLTLSLDLDVQRVAQKALAEGIARARTQRFRETGERFRAPAGAAVVLDAKTGEVVAMASHPTFDLKEFVGGVSQKYFDTLQDTDNFFPLLNRAVQASYPPGSTIKPVVATGALESGIATRGGGYPCQTEYRYGDRVFRNWKPRNATISIAQSLIESCDTVYYSFGVRWYNRDVAATRAQKKAPESEQHWMRQFGLGALTGLDLPGERSGRVPDRTYRQSVWEANKNEYCRRYRETKDRLFEDLCARGYLWRPGDSINMSIGQGDVEATPLQMAIAYAAVANGGKVLVPHIGKTISEPDGTVVRRIKPKTKRSLKSSASTKAYIRSALRATVDRGTASYPFRGWPTGSIPMAGKTGSAEIDGKQPYSWFASYGPTTNPKYVVVAAIEEAGFGSQVAGPVVRRIMDELFNQKPLPIEFGAVSD